MSTSVKHIHNGMRGAPQIGGTAGTLIAALDALFISGWGATAALSVNVAAGVATATLTPGETFDRDAVVLIAGATPGALNGEARVISTSNTSITWATTAPDGAATGTITIRYAPQTSWAKVYAGTNKAAYRSTHVQSAGHYLRIDDTGTTGARMRGYESMTDVDTGVGPFPSEAQQAGGGYLWKSVVASAAAVRYRIICDERFVLFCIGVGTGNNPSVASSAQARGFGDPISASGAGDAWATICSVGGPNASSSQMTGSLDSTLISSVGSGATYAPRAFSGLGSSVLMDPRAFSCSPGVASGVDSFLGALPSEIDGQIKPSRMAEVGNTKPPRATVPGVFYIPQSGALGQINEGDMLDGSADVAGHRLMVLPTGSNSYTSSPTGAYLVDLTGPWR